MKQFGGYIDSQVINFKVAFRKMSAKNENEWFHETACF